MTARRASDRPAPRRESAEKRWYEAGIKDLDAERLYYQEETKRLRYERMERDTGPRGRREYDFAEDVERESAAELIYQLSEWVSESASPILVRINTPGGDETAGLAIVDFIRSLSVQVDTLGMGEVASMGSVLLQAGDTRYLQPSCVMLIHESRTFGQDAPVMEKLTDMKSRVRLGDMLERRSNELLAERSVFSDADELAYHYAASDWWLAADEAIALGFADAIW